MNRALLSPDGPERVVVQVDWIAGCEPLQSSLDALASFLRRETGGKSVEVRRGNEVPRESGAGLDAIAGEAQAHASPPDGAYFVYVLYCDRLDSYRGITFAENELRESVGFPVVAIFVRAIRHDSWLWLTRRKVERAVLVHEFGHVAGLVTSGRATGKAGREGHCPDPKCRMYWGVDARSIRANWFPVLCEGRLPLTFCAVCEKELAEGRAPQKPAANP